MGIEVQKSALPILFHFAGVRAASQPHVREYDHNIARQSYFFSLTLTASPSLGLYFLDIITNTKCDYGFHYCSINQWGKEKRHRKRFAVTHGLEATKSSQMSFYYEGYKNNKNGKMMDFCSMKTAAV